MKNLLTGAGFFLAVLTAGSAAADLLISWKPGLVAADFSNVPASFRLYRRAVNAPYELLQEIAVARLPDGTIAAEFSTMDTTVAIGAEYCYQVSAANAAGESSPSNEGCAIPIDGQTVALQIPSGRTPLISRRATDASSLVSILANKSDVVSINDSTLAPAATVVMAAPAGKTVLVSKRANDGSSLFSILVNKSQVLFINEIKQP
jgi:hypothetical protein